jgi:hypothetical protein
MEQVKQTAVEWLIENLITEPFSEADFEHNSNCWDKAKEMEKQQIIDAYNNGDNRSAELYYNETFKSE